MDTGPIDTVAVVIPVHNEQDLLPRCLNALHAAIDALTGPERTGLGIRVLLVLDSCDDGSQEIAARSSFDTTELTANNVGAARACGVGAALARLEPSTELGRVWIANTDADSAVPPNWLSHQLSLAAGGVQLMIGTVRPDSHDLDPVRWARWLATHTPGAANGHVHGANLGVRADTYCSVGGFEPIVEHEDVRLVDRMRAAGAITVATDACSVLTSGRAAGRTPGGYARYIREELLQSPRVGNP